MKILLCSTSSPYEMIGIGKYNGELMRWFRDRGHQVDVLTTLPYYPYWEIYEDYKGETFKAESSGEGTIYSFRLPVSKEVSSIRRVWIDLIFLLKTLFRLPYLAFRKKYDIILLVLPTMTGFPSAILGKLMSRAKLHIHVQDMELETARELGMLPAPILNILGKFERMCLKSADFVSSISHNMVKQMEEKVRSSSTRLGMITNWTDTHSIHPVKNQQWLKRSYGYGDGTFLVVYSGNIGKKQGVEQIFPVASILQQYGDIEILILGDGANREELIQKSEILQLKNLRFGELVPKDKLNLMLNGSDVQLILQRKSSGDSFMPSKFINILSAGVPSVVTANKGTELYNIAIEKSTSLIVEPENAAQLAEAILMLRNDQRLGQTLALNAREFALAKYEREGILQELEGIYKELVSV